MPSHLCEQPNWKTHVGRRTLWISAAAAAVNRAISALLLEKEQQRHESQLKNKLCRKSQVKNVSSVESSPNLQHCTVQPDKQLKTHFPRLRTHLLCRYPLHFGRRGAGPGVELVNEQTGELVLGTQLQSALEVPLRFSWEATDDVRADGDAGYSGGREVGRIDTGIRDDQILIAEVL